MHLQIAQAIMGAIDWQVLIAQRVVHLIGHTAQQVFVRFQDRAALRGGDQFFIRIH